MANIQKRVSKTGKVSYRALIRLKGHPAESATFNRKTDAQKWIQSTEAAIREGRHFKQSESRKRTLTELIERYKKTILPTKPKSAYEQSYQLDWWNDELGAYYLSDITPAVLSQAKEKLLASNTSRGKQRSPSTVVRYMAALSHAFTVAAKEWQWVDDNPFRNISRPKEPRGRIRYLEREEIEKVLQACEESAHPYLATIFVLAISTGMRKGEILNLTWSDIDLQRGRMVLNETKNDERRVVPLQGEALKRVRELSKVRHLNTNLLFPSEHAQNKVKKIDPAWRAALETAGIEDYRFHDNRHTAASYLAMNGASLSEIAEILRHKTLSMKLSATPT